MTTNYLTNKLKDHRSLSELRALAEERGIVPAGDKRLKATWANALAAPAPEPPPSEPAAKVDVIAHNQVEETMQAKTISNDSTDLKLVRRNALKKQCRAFHGITSATVNSKTTNYKTEPFFDFPQIEKAYEQYPNSRLYQASEWVYVLFVGTGDTTYRFAINHQPLSNMKPATAQPEVNRDLQLELIDAQERLITALETVNKIDTEVTQLKAQIATAMLTQNPPGTIMQAPSKQPSKPAKTTNLDSIFGERIKEKEQFLIIVNELAAIGVKVGKLINSRSDVKGWRLDWDGDKAGLYWTTGNGWEVDSLKPDSELGGQWEGFDLTEQLSMNGIDLDEESTASLAA